jgi:hypothetical protein
MSLSPRGDKGWGEKIRFRGGTYRRKRIGLTAGNELGGGSTPGPPGPAPGGGYPGRGAFRGTDLRGHSTGKGPLGLSLGEGSDPSSQAWRPFAKRKMLPRVKGPQVLASGLANPQTGVGQRGTASYWVPDRFTRRARAARASRLTRTP